MKRFEFVVKYDGTNKTQRIVSEGQDVFECLENMIDEIEDFKSEFENNNFDNGGNTAFTKDAQMLYEECNDIISNINKVL